MLEHRKYMRLSSKSIFKKYEIIYKRKLNYVCAMIVSHEDISLKLLK